MNNKFYPPKYNETSFHCPFCNVYAKQNWHSVGYYGVAISGFGLSRCGHCEKIAFWVEEDLVYPKSSIAPMPFDEMPEDVKDDYLEARNIINDSPRGAAALLRLAVQKLCVHLGEKGKNINNDIALLVSKGLSPKIQKALDSVRVIGNNAVHPGEIDLEDDKNTALALFNLLNIITETMIIQPAQIDKMYESLPETAKRQIEERDSKE